MSKQKWTQDLIAGEIRRLSAAGHELMQSRIAAIDSRLTSAAIRYYGSWGAAVAAAGIDYARVAAAGRQSRSAKVTKWTSVRIQEEIRGLHEAGEELSSAVVRRKHLALYATARRKEHFGSWAAAVTAAGINYDGVKQDATARRRRQARWKKQLLADHRASPRLLKAPALPEAYVTASEPRLDLGDGSDGAAPPQSQWWRGLLLEKLAEIYEHQTSELPDVAAVLKQLIDRQVHGPRPEI